MWTEALMHRHPIIVIYLDYAKAYDTVPHQRLLHQIYSLGIQGTAIDFIRAFLTSRRQRTRVNRSYYTWKSVISGTYLLVILVVVWQYLIGSQVLTRCPPL